MGVTLIGLSIDAQALRRLSIGVLCLALHPAFAEAKTSDVKTSVPYGKLPLSFETNQGQADSEVRFLARSGDYSLFLTDTGAVLAFSGIDSAQLALRSPVAAPAHSFGSMPGEPMILAAKPQDLTAQGSVLRMELTDSRLDVEPIGENALPGNANYFIGNDPAQWHTAIPTYSKVRYSDVYPGVDLVYYGNQQQLEYDFDLAPGADASAIQLRFGGAERLTIDAGGNLAIETASGSIQFRKPDVYQAVDGRKIAVEGAFDLMADNSVGFRLGPYDHSKPLTIDPVLGYSTLLSGTADSGGQAITVDAEGEAIVTGYSLSKGFPTTPGSYEPDNPLLDNQEDNVIYVAKLNATGTALVYSTYLGGKTLWDQYNASFGIASDAEGNAYIVGFTPAEDFPTTPGAFQRTNRAEKKYPVSVGFVAKINASGSKLLYSTLLGGTANNGTEAGINTQPGAVAVDKEGDAYVTGRTWAKDFPVTPGAFQPKIEPANVQGAAFVTKFNKDGSALEYSTYLGGNFRDVASGIAVAGDGTAYVVGYTASRDFPVTPDALEKTSRQTGGATGFYSKVNATGTKLVYSTYLGGTRSDWAVGVALDAEGSAYVTGTAGSPNFPTTLGAYRRRQLDVSSDNAFITKFRNKGTVLEYSTLLGGNLSDYPAGIAIDSAGNAIIAGGTFSDNFPMPPGAFQPFNYSWDVSNNEGSFLAKVNPKGSALVYATFLNGGGDETGYGDGCDCVNSLAIDSSGNVYLTGETVSYDFPVTPGAFQTNIPRFAGCVPGGCLATSAFVTKFNADEMVRLPVPAVTLTSDANPQFMGNDITFTASVQGPSGHAVPTGLIAFDTDYYDWEPVELDSTGKASVTVPAKEFFPYVGPNPIVATYFGDENHSAATGSLVETVNLIPVKIEVTASANPVKYGTPVTITAKVVGTPRNPIPTGFVVFAVDSANRPEVPMDSSGAAKMTLDRLPVGKHTIAAGYFPSDPVHSPIAAAYITEKILAFGTTPPPIFSPAAGTYGSPRKVYLSDKMERAQFIYTTDGSDPHDSNFALMYEGRPIYVGRSKTIKAYAVAPGYLPSPVTSAKYVITSP